MSCAACANAVEKALNKNNDINASVNIATEKLNIEYDEKKYDFDKIREIVESAGYGLVEDMTEDKKDGTLSRENKKLEKSFNFGNYFCCSTFVYFDGAYAWGSTS